MTDAYDLEQLDRLVQEVWLPVWGLPAGFSSRRINIAENVTYLVETGRRDFVLRVHRPGYHSKRAIECELAWMKALREEGGVPTPRPVADTSQRFVANFGEGRYAVLFEHLPGVHPDENDDLEASFEDLGAIAARTHLHSIGWKRPEPFERLSWGIDEASSAFCVWGDWRDGPNVTPGVREVLEQVEGVMVRRLTTFGRGPDRFGLIHSDMRLANLLIDGDTTQVIDFDDCGFGWFLYDFASAISFIEDHPQVPALRSAWVRGYRKVRALPVEDEREISSFVMLRRLALLAWIGSRAEAPEPQRYAPHFARVTADLGKSYLSEMG